MPQNNRNDPIAAGIVRGQSKLSAGNMSYARGNMADTMNNRRKFLYSYDLDLNNLTAAGLVHGNNCEIADKYFAGRGASSLDDAIPGTDALVTTEPGLILAVTTADCLPVFLWSDDYKVVGIAHAGWKGLAGGVVKNLVKQARYLNNIALNRFFIKIGAAIGPCCYVVDAERLKKFTGYPMCEIHWRQGKMAHLNLSAVASIQAHRQGIPEENIEITEECTCCGNNYPSFRRDGENYEPDLAFIVRN